MNSRKEYFREYWNAHKIQHREGVARYRKTLRYRKTYTKWYKSNREHILKICRNYRSTLERKEYMKNYRKTHKSRIRELQTSWEKTKYGKILHKRSQKKYFKSDKGRAVIRRKGFKRRRLGFIPLNSVFPNSHAHHIDRNYIIYIPKDIHQSICHSLNNVESMEKINKIAFRYMEWIEG